MAQDNFTACLAETLRWEGDWADHPKDPGGATMKGITLATYRQRKPGATKADLRAITDAEVELIYRTGYWNPINGDQLPHGVDLVVFDGGVNSGWRQSAKWLQRAVGFTGKAVDGIVGPNTLTATLARAAIPVIKSVCKQRLDMYRNLAGWITFGKGWTNRIAGAAGIEAAGLKMAGASMRHESDKAAKESERHKTEAASGAATGGFGGIGLDQADMPTVLVAVIVIAGVLFAWRSYREVQIDKARAKAMRNA